MVFSCVFLGLITIAIIECIPAFLPLKLGDRCHDTSPVVESESLYAFDVSTIYTLAEGASALFPISLQPYPHGLAPKERSIVLDALKDASPDQIKAFINNGPFLKYYFGEPYYMANAIKLLLKTPDIDLAIVAAWSLNGGFYEEYGNNNIQKRFENLEYIFTDDNTGNLAPFFKSRKYPETPWHADKSVDLKKMAEEHFKERGRYRYGYYSNSRKKA